MLVGTTHRLPAAVYPNIRVSGEPREQVNLVSGVHFDFRLEEFCPTYPGMACYQIARSRRKRLALDNTMQACLYNEYKATADRAHSFQQLYEAGLKSKLTSFSKLVWCNLCQSSKDDIKWLGDIIRLHRTQMARTRPSTYYKTLRLVISDSSRQQAMATLFELI